MTRALGVDTGQRRIGIALSDATGTLASPLTVLERKGDSGCETWNQIARLVVENQVGVIVVGLPLSLDGVERQPALDARRDAAEIARAAGMEVLLFDERLSTVSASRRLAEGGGRRAPRSSRLDASAAAVMLQGWLDSPHGRELRNREAG